MADDIGWLRVSVVLILLAAFVSLDNGAMRSPECGDMLKALSYPLYHANVFHLAGNCIGVWIAFSPRRGGNAWTLSASFGISVCAWWMSRMPVVGFSNILYASAGLRCQDLIPRGGGRRR